MYRTASRVGLFAALLLGLMTAVLTPDTGLAHDVDACRGRSGLAPYADDWYHYSNTSACPENWDTMAVAAFLVRFQDMQFEVEGFLGWNIREDSSLASMKGFDELTHTDRCYINVGWHAALNVHLTIPPREDHWFAVSFSPLQCPS